MKTISRSASQNILLARWLIFLWYSDNLSGNIDFLFGEDTKQGLLFGFSSVWCPH
jgi:hypothetical protein